MNHIIKFTLIFLVCASRLTGQETSRDQFYRELVLLRSTGQEIDQVPVFRLIGSDDTVFHNVMEKTGNSYIAYSVKLYHYVQQYLKNQREIPGIEPAYLALTENEGCFGSIGFYLDDKGDISEKLDAGYIDLHKNMVSRPFDKLGSPSQIFPHEMGHVIQQLLCGKIGNNDLPGATDTHYFSVLTDYRTAFSEGFAEHFENMSRDNEANQYIRKGVQDDSTRISNTQQSYKRSFTRDFELPFRMDFYRVTCPLWYQQFEHYKRYAWAERNYARYNTTTTGRPGNDRYLLFRNTGISFDQVLRTIPQCESNEGVISSFFYHLVNSDCKNVYADTSFYRMFLPPNASDAGSIIPFDNIYLKIFHVLHLHIQSEDYGTSLLHRFIQGYIELFPNEKNIVLQVYKSSTGHDYIEKEVPEIWLIARNFKHSFWVMAQFGLKSPYYTFNLNAADIGDLLTLDGISRDEAQTLVDHRDAVFCLNSVNDVSEIDAVSQRAKQAINAAVITEMPGISLPGKKFTDLLTYPLLKLGSNLLLWFTIFMIGFYFLYYKQHTRQVRGWKFVAGKFVSFVMITILALISTVMFSSPVIPFCIIVALVMGLKMLINRKNKTRMKESVLSFLVMALIMIYSLI